MNHVIVLNERHLMRVLGSYFAYYHESRTHLSLNRNAPVEREVEPPQRDKVIAIPQVGGLHHRYCRAARMDLNSPGSPPPQPIVRAGHASHALPHIGKCKPRWFFHGSRMLGSAARSPAGRRLRLDEVFGRDRRISPSPSPSR